MNIKEWAAYCETNVTGGYTPGGNARNIPASGLAIVEFLQKLGILRDKVSILDVGCANGRLAIGLDMSTVKRFSYHGLEIVQPAVEFCQQAFRSKPHFHFTHLDVYNARYWPNGTIKPLHVIYPVEDASVDVVIANSVYTHVHYYAEAAHYLDEMTRVLKPGGMLYSTWSFTTLRAQVAINAKHTIWHFNRILQLLEGRDYRFLSLDNNDFPNWYTLIGAPNQVGIVVTKCATC